jgi:hypothetical protein
MELMVQNCDVFLCTPAGVNDKEDTMRLLRVEVYLESFLTFKIRQRRVISIMLRPFFHWFPLGWKLGGLLN